MPFGGAVLSAVREVQIPIIAALLIGACAAKARRAVHSHSVDAALSPTAMFPLMLRKPMTIAICGGECVLGAGLVLTAGQIGAGLPATVVRACTALLFGTAVGALNELRHRRPSAGCGCFGDLSQAPVSTRTLARSHTRPVRRPGGPPLPTAAAAQRLPAISGPPTAAAGTRARTAPSRGPRPSAGRRARRRRSAPDGSRRGR